MGSFYKQTRCDGDSERVDMSVDNELEQNELCWSQAIPTGSNDAACCTAGNRSHAETRSGLSGRSHIDIPFIRSSFYQRQRQITAESDNQARAVTLDFMPWTLSLDRPLACINLLFLRCPDSVPTPSQSEAKRTFQVLQPQFNKHGLRQSARYRGCASVRWGTGIC
jgi:hypothetical protein